MAQNHTHEYDCRICGAHLDSQNDLNQHMRERHAQHGASRGRDQVSRGDQGGRSESGEDASRR